jgi:hypothetical protein
MSKKYRDIYNNITKYLSLPKELYELVNEEKGRKEIDNALKRLTSTESKNELEREFGMDDRYFQQNLNQFIENLETKINENKTDRDVESLQIAKSLNYIYSVIKFQYKNLSAEDILKTSEFKRKESKEEKKIPIRFGRAGYQAQQKLLKEKYKEIYKATKKLLPSDEELKSLTKDELTHVLDIMEDNLKKMFNINLDLYKSRRFEESLGLYIDNLRGEIALYSVANDRNRVELLKKELEMAQLLNYIRLLLLNKYLYFTKIPKLTKEKKEKYKLELEKKQKELEEGKIEQEKKEEKKKKGEKLTFIRRKRRTVSDIDKLLFKYNRATDPEIKNKLFTALIKEMIANEDKTEDIEFTTKRIEDEDKNEIKVLILKNEYPTLYSDFSKLGGYLVNKRIKVKEKIKEINEFRFPYNSKKKKNFLKERITNLIINFRTSLENIKKLRNISKSDRDKKKELRLASHEVRDTTPEGKLSSEQIGELSVLAEQYYKHKLSEDEERIVKKLEELDKIEDDMQKKRENRRSKFEDAEAELEQQFEGEKEPEEEREEFELEEEEEKEGKEKSKNEKKLESEEYEDEETDEEEEENVSLEEESAQKASLMLEPQTIEKEKRGKYVVENVYVVAFKLPELYNKFKALDGRWNKQKKQWVFSAEKVKNKKGEYVEGDIKNKLLNVLQNYITKKKLEEQSKEKQLSKIAQEIENALENKEEKGEKKEKKKLLKKEKRINEPKIFKEVVELINKVKDDVKQRGQHQLITKQLRNPLYRLSKRRLQRKIESKNPLLHITKKEEKKEIIEEIDINKYKQIGHVFGVYKTIISDELLAEYYKKGTKKYVTIVSDLEYKKQPISSPEILSTIAIGQDINIDSSVQLVLFSYMINVLENNIIIRGLLKQEDVKSYLTTLARQILDNYLNLYKNVSEEFSDFTIYSLLKAIITPFIFLDSSNELGKRATTFRTRLMNESYINIAFLSLNDIFPEVFSNPHITDVDKLEIKEYIYKFIEEEINTHISLIYYELQGKKINRAPYNVLIDIVPDKLLDMPVKADEIFQYFDFCNASLFGNEDDKYTADNTIIYYENTVNYCFTIDELLALEPPYINKFTETPIDEKFMINFKLNYREGRKLELKEYKEEKEGKGEGKKSGSFHYEIHTGKKIGTGGKFTAEWKGSPYSLDKHTCHTCKKLIDDKDSIRSIIYELDAGQNEDNLSEIIYLCAKGGCLEKSGIPEQLPRKKKKKQ